VAASLPRGRRPTMADAHPHLPGATDGLQPNALYIGFVVVAACVVIGGSLGRPLTEYAMLSPALQATLLGLVVGIPAGEYIPSVEDTFLIPKVLSEIVRVVIVVQLMATALALPPKYLRRHWRQLALMLGPVTLAMWTISSGFVLACLPGIGTWEAFVIGACFAPTDPVLAATVLRGRLAEERIPLPLRELLMAESGMNDGTAYPLVYLGILFLTLEPGPAIGRWFYDIWIYGVLLSIVLGAVLGWGALKLLLWSEEYRLFDRQSYLAFSVVLSIGLLGVGELLKTNAFLMVFVASVVLANHEKAEDRNSEANVQDAADILCMATFFVVFGATLPWDTFGQLGVGRLIGLSVAVFVLRRVPATLAVKYFVPEYASWHDAIFAGVFGPVGTGAVLYGILAYEATGNLAILAVVEFVVFMNVIFFSIAGPIGTRIVHKKRRATLEAAAAAEGDAPSHELDKVAKDADDDASSKAPPAAVESSSLIANGEASKDLEQVV